MLTMLTTEMVGSEKFEFLSKVLFYYILFYYVYYSIKDKVKQIEKARYL